MAILRNELEDRPAAIAVIACCVPACRRGAIERMPLTEGQPTQRRETVAATAEAVEDILGPGPTLHYRWHQLEHYSLAELATFRGCAIEITILTQNRANGWHVAILNQGEVVQNGLRPGTALRWTQFEDIAISIPCPKARAVEIALLIEDQAG